MSNLLTTYLGSGTHAARPATPPIAAGTVGLYWETDTKSLFAYDLTNNAWTALGGASAGTPPTIVQSAHSIAGGNSITLGAAPTNGNLLVAMGFNPGSASVGSGWTSVITNTSGTDFGVLAIKTAGASESATQTPGSSWDATSCAAIIWEIHGAVVGVLLDTIAAEGTGTTGSTSPLPIFSNTLFLGAIGLVSTANNNTTQFVAHSDAKDVSGAHRQLSAGHATLADSAIGAIAQAFSASSSFKAIGAIIA